MKVGLSKKEINIILNFMEYGVAFKGDKGRADANILKMKLRKKIDVKLFKCPVCGILYEGRQKDTGGRCKAIGCTGNRNSILEEVGREEETGKSVYIQKK